MRSLLRGIGKLLKWSAISLVVVLVAITTWAQVARRADARIAAPGQLVEVEPGRRMHIICMGQGEPTVVLEAGLGDYGWSSWASVQPQIAQVTRTCSYDRAATGWSDPPRVDPMPSAMVDDLRALLRGAGEKPPFVLAGHSLGGPIVRHYARRFPSDVVGLVLVDGSHEDQLTRLPKPPRATELLIGLMPAVHFLGLDRLGGAFTSDTGAKTQTARKTSNVAMHNTLWLYDHLDRFLAQARDSGTSLGDIPLVALTAGTIAAPAVSPEQAAKFHATWVKLNEEIATYSTRGRQYIVPNSTHYIQRDDPQAVIDAVTTMVREARASRIPVSPPR